MKHPLSATLFVLFATLIPLRATEIQDAIRAGDLEKVKTLVAATPTLLQPEAGNWTPLHEAVKAGQKPIVEFLIASKANLNAKDDGGFAPLHVAARLGNKEMVQLLVGKDASLTARTKEGQTPLHVACSLLQQEVIVILLAARADIANKDDSGRSPIFLAMMTNDKSIADAGLKAGNRKEIIELLLKKKANPSAMDTNGNTLLKIATDAGYTDIVELLKKYGAEEPEPEKPATTP